MAENIIGNSRKTFLKLLLYLADIIDNTLKTIVSQITPVFLGSHRIPVPQMVIADNNNSLCAQKSCEIVIPVHILHHPMDNLKHCPHLHILRNPAYTVNPCFFIA